MCLRARGRAVLYVLECDCLTVCVYVRGRACAGVGWGGVGWGGWVAGMGCSGFFINTNTIPPYFNWCPRGGGGGGWQGKGRRGCLH